MHKVKSNKQQVGQQKRSAYAPACSHAYKLRQTDSQISQILPHLDQLLVKAYSTIAANRFHLLLLAATRELFLTIQKLYQEADSIPLEQSVSVLEKWVADFHAGGEILSTLFLSKALCYSQRDDTQAAERYVEKAKQAIEETSGSYFLCRVLTVQGDVLLAGKPTQALQAYRNCITYCQKASLVTSNQQILEEFKTTLVICNYKLALLERLDSNDNDTILKYLCESARSARDLFGQNSPVFQRFEQYYFEEQNRRKRILKAEGAVVRPEQVDESDRHLIYEGQIECTENDQRGSGEISIHYRPDNKQMDVQFRKGNKGRKQKMQITEKIEIPLASIPELSKKINWISIANNKININHTQIRNIITQQQKQYRTFLKQIGRQEMFDDKDIDNSSDEENEKSGQNRNTTPLISSLKSLSVFTKHASLKN